jgi:hypothetical protein
MSKVQAIVAAIAVLGALASSGCGKNEVDDSPNKLPVADVQAGDSTTLPGDATAASCDCLQKGMWFRFDTLQIKSLDGGQHLVMTTLNPLWQADIDAYELNFYLEVLEVGETDFKLRIVNAARTGKPKSGAVCLLPSTESVVTMSRKGCRIENPKPTGLNVYAGTPANPKNCTTGLQVPHSIPVRNAFFQGDLRSDCSAVDNGLLIEGSIAKAALDNTCTCLTIGDKSAEDCGVPAASFAGYPSQKNEDGQPPKFCTSCCQGCNDNYSNLNELLDSFGPLKYGCKDEAGTGVAVCLSATFSAKRIDTPPTPCP